MDCTLETIVVDTVVSKERSSILKIVPRDPDEFTTRSSGISSTIRVIPSLKALYDLVEDGGFKRIQFLKPSRALPREYRTGERVSLIAQRE